MANDDDGGSDEDCLRDGEVFRSGRSIAIGQLDSTPAFVAASVDHADVATSFMVGTSSSWWRTLLLGPGQRQPSNPVFTAPPLEYRAAAPLDVKPRRQHFASRQAASSAAELGAGR